MNIHHVHLPEIHVPGKRLGRHVEHDLRSKTFKVVHPPAAKLVSKKWVRHGSIFNQGDLGSCTGNAMAGVINTEPFYIVGRTFTEKNAVLLYENATRLDDIAGQYPPDDTGSSGLAVAKAAQQLGLVASYSHAMTTNDALLALSNIGPIIVGIEWYEGFDTPQGDGALLVIGGAVRGGHELEVDEIDVDKKLIRIPNSWGTSWGDKGYCTMSFDTFDRLLHSQGDATIPVKH